MANRNLNAAKTAKNDEFYTQFYDIETEMEAYLDYNRDVFRGKTVLLPCDDPEWSNFTRYFAQNFETLGLKKLISTSYALESKTYKCGYQLSLFETESPKFDKEKTKTHGKIFILTEDTTGDGVINLDDLQWDYLEGDGDFRSKEVTRLRDEADIIITNPPYGERLEEKADLPELYRTIGDRFAKLDTWSMYLITSYEDAQNAIGKKADKNRKIYNGMIKTYFYQFMGPKPPKRKKEMQ